MSLRAPLRVPIELQLGEPAQGARRWFRLSAEIGTSALLLGGDLPPELDAPPRITFHLPGDPLPLLCRATVHEEIVGAGDDERAAPRRLEFLDLNDSDRARLASYVTLSLGIV